MRDKNYHYELRLLASVGACNCCTKNAAVTFHDRDCKFRLLHEIASYVEKLELEHDKWKAMAEYQYGRLRKEKYGDINYPVEGALDAYFESKTIEEIRVKQ